MLRLFKLFLPLSIKKLLKKKFLIFRISKDRTSKLLRNISIDEGCRIGPWVIIDGEDGYIKIGKNCSVNSFSWLGAGNSSIEIGDNVRIGTGTTITCSNHIFTDKSELIKNQGLKKNVNIKIEENVWIGANVVILPDVVIESGSVIGAGSVITKKVSRNSVVVGNPGKLLRKR